MATSFPDPDMTLIGELIEHIERSPPALEACKVLMHQYLTCGWFAAAREMAQEVLKLDSSDTEARVCLDDRPARTEGKGEGKGKGKGKGKGVVERKGKAKATIGQAKSDGKSKKTEGQGERDASAWQPTVSPIPDPAAALRDLEEGYASLLTNVRLLQRETKLLHDIGGMRALRREGHLLDLAALSQGKVSRVVREKPLESVKVVARAIMKEQKSVSNLGLDVAFKDLEEMVKWLTKSDEGKAVAADDYDAVRDALVKRVSALKGLLPNDSQVVADEALMHAEHELLQRTYVNTETMYGDEVCDISREKFWVSDDGYAWDMEELAQAIKIGGGVMRNPLSKVMFTPADVGHIVHHPLGKGLAALQVAQSKLKKGVRQSTISELEKLANILLEDMTEDQAPSRTAVDSFVAYLATLPSAEQKAIDGLRVPAKDSHTGMEYDTTIGEAVKDVQGNRVCSHKTGDFLNQAVNHLRK